MYIVVYWTHAAKLSDSKACLLPGVVRMVCFFFLVMEEKIASESLKRDKYQQPVPPPPPLRLSAQMSTLRERIFHSYPTVKRGVHRPLMAACRVFPAKDKPGHSPCTSGPLAHSGGSIFGSLVVLGKDGKLFLSAK